MTQEIATERLEELHVMASEIYTAIRNSCNTPYEAITLVTMIHLTVWLNGKADGISAEKMLLDYCANFILNVEANERSPQ